MHLLHSQSGASFRIVYYIIYYSDVGFKSDKLQLLNFEPSHNGIVLCSYCGILSWVSKESCSRTGLSNLNQPRAAHLSVRSYREPHETKLREFYRFSKAF